MMIFHVVICSPYILSTALAQYNPTPRWAQAVALLENTLYVHGGLSDPYNSYSYSSAPEIADLLVLDLATSFDSSSPPWKLFSTNSSPALAWHTLSAFNPAELLVFGGQPGPNSLPALTALNDSSGLLSTSQSAPSFFMEPQNWVNEPMRRIRHSSSYTSGMVWIIGGEKADGSGNAFNEHYAFDPSRPGFVQLPPESSAPPDIYGHASLVLPDGRLLVLGGYCASCSELVPMNTVWSLNTTTNPPVWEKLSTLNSSLPNPRRDFAAVVLSTGQVLIHGGGDAQLQTTYSDGWILDTGQNPMLWISVAALGQLGPRKDHVAVQANGYVLFCFGYGSSSPAPASLFVYDPTTSSMVTSYTAPSFDSTPAIISLSAPTQTSSGSDPHGGTSTTSPWGASSTPSYSTGSPASSSSRTTAIAIGTTFGVLMLVAIGIATTYCMKRACNRDGGTSRGFFLLGNGPELLEDGSVRSATAPEAAHFNDQTMAVDRPGVVTDLLAHLGVSTKLRHPRKDMFVDEDRSFGEGGYPGTVYRQDSGETGGWSLRSVSALVRGVIGREPSGSGVDQGDHEWQKIGHLREEGQEGLIRPGSFHSVASSHPTHRSDGSSCTDPFKDPHPDDDYGDLNLRPGIPEKDADYDHFATRNDGTDISEWSALDPQDPIWPFSERSRILTPLREVSQISLTDRSNSLPSVREPSDGEIIPGHADNATFPSPAGTSPTSYSPTLSRFSDSPIVPFTPRHSTVSCSTLSRSPSISRADSWWMRIAKSPFLDRRASISSSKPVDFRDPTPAPPLIASEEMKKSFVVPAYSDDTLVDVLVKHDRSLSSIHSGRTANTNAAERLGGSHDVVQRLGSDGSSSRRVPSSLGFVEITEPEMMVSAVDRVASTDGALSSNSPHVDPPRSALFPTQAALSTDMETPSEPVMSLKSVLPSPSAGAIVSSRVRAYERRLSQHLESLETPLPRNTRRLEEVPSRSRPTIQYGVVPRSSLYVANPDLGHRGHNS